MEHLNEEEKEHFIRIVKDYPDIFYLSGERLTPTHLVHRIHMMDDVPIYVHPYRFVPTQNEEGKLVLNKMLTEGRIEHLNSPYSSPILLIPKKLDHIGKIKYRIVIDYRLLNEKTIGDAYLLKNICEILDHLGKCRYFTVFDLSSGFYQIEQDQVLLGLQGEELFIYSTQKSSKNMR